MDVSCASCGETFQAKNPRAKYCSDRCRKRRQRGGEVVELPSEPKQAESPVQGVTEAVRAELEAAGRLDSALGQACMVLARRLDAPGVDTGSAMSSVAARLEDLLAKAKRGGKSATAPDKLRDEIAERRAMRGA